MKRIDIRRRLLATATVALTVCGVSYSVPAQAIISGASAVDGGITRQPAIVKLYGDAHDTFNNDRDVNCTGTLITPNWVLTAQHCTNRAEDQLHPFPARDMKISFRRGANNAAQDRTPDSIYRMHSFQTSPGGNDIAMLHFVNPVTGVVPLPLVAGAALPGIGQVEQYGYGTTTANGTSPSQDLRFAAEGVFPYSTIRNLVSQTRCPNGGCWNPTNVLISHDIGRGRGAKGDSGGPALVRYATGHVAVAGVTQGSFYNADHRYFGFFNRVDSSSAPYSFIHGLVPSVTTLGPSYLDGALLKEASSAWVYVMYGGAQFRIPDATAFNQLGLNWSNIRTVPDGTMRGVPRAPMNGTILREYSNPQVYRVDEGRKRPVALAEYQANGYGPLLHYVPNGALSQIG